MLAIILAAGKGSRLRPITKSRPKAMLPILGKPIIERVMDVFYENGINHFILVINPIDSIIENYFSKKSKSKFKIQFVFQKESLGTAKALSLASHLIDGDFFVAACDNIFKSETIKNMLSAWEDTNHPDALLALIQVEDELISTTARVGVMHDDRNHIRISEIIEKPTISQAPSRIASVPLYIFSKKFLNYIYDVELSPRGEYELQSAIQSMIQDSASLYGIDISHRLTLTIISDLLTINTVLLSCCYEGQHPPPTYIGNNSILISPYYLGPDTIIGDYCSIGPNVYFEGNNKIGNNVVISNSVLLNGTSLANHSQIINQVLY